MVDRYRAIVEIAVGTNNVPTLAAKGKPRCDIQIA